MVKKHGYQAAFAGVAMMFGCIAPVAGQASQGSQPAQASQASPASQPSGVPTPAVSTDVAIAKPAVPPTPVKPAGIAVPADYVLGPDDVVGVLFWREPEMTGDVSVRPDGMISLPLIGDVQAAGLAPDALKDEIEKAAEKFITAPNVTVLVKQINSRRVFITGEVANPGAYPLSAPRTVMQIIALAGGLKEYADAKHITIMRTENGRQRSFKFNYKDVAKGKALSQNIQLKPGDTVVVP